MGINPNPSSIMPEMNPGTISNNKGKMLRKAFPPFINTTPQTTPMSSPRHTHEERKTIFSF